jgi:hypothetical protein
VRLELAGSTIEDERVLIGNPRRVDIEELRQATEDPDRGHAIFLTRRMLPA